MIVSYPNAIYKLCIGHRIFQYQTFVGVDSFDIGSAIWFVSLIVGGVYLWQRRHVID